MKTDYLILLGAYGKEDGGFQVNQSMDQCFAETKKLQQITIVDTKGLRLGNLDYLNRDIIKSISQEEFDVIFFLVPTSSLSGDDSRLFDFLMMNLFTSEAERSRIFLILPFHGIESNHPHLADAWLRDQLQRGTNFKKYYELVGLNAKRVIFVDNIEPSRQVLEFEKKKALEKNTKTAQRIFDVLNDPEFRSMDTLIQFDEPSMWYSVLKFANLCPGGTQISSFLFDCLNLRHFFLDMRHRDG